MDQQYPLPRLASQPGEFMMLVEIAAEGDTPPAE